MTGMTPNPRFDRSAQRRCRWVPVALRAPAPGQPERWASEALPEYTFLMLTIASNLP
jgi:hypothetical protein